MALGRPWGGGRAVLLCDVGYRDTSKVARFVDGIARRGVVEGVEAVTAGVGLEVRALDAT